MAMPTGFRIEGLGLTTPLAAHRGRCLHRLPVSVLQDVRGAQWAGDRRNGRQGADHPRLPPARLARSSLDDAVLHAYGRRVGQRVPTADAFREYLYTLYDNQPREGPAGLSDEELVQLGLEVGLDESFGRCVTAGLNIEWVEYVTARASARGVNGTPSVYVDGVGVPASAEAIMGPP